MEKSKMDLLYETYLERDDRTAVIDGRTFYRILEKHKLQVRSEILITIPHFVHTFPAIVTDENGASFQIGPPAHFSFHGLEEIPRWYVETITVPVNHVADPKEIGEYLALF